jgi:CRP/FNR family transcriptional regulator, anaerobic regulatory protein
MTVTDHILFELMLGYAAPTRAKQQNRFDGEIHDVNRHDVRRQILSFVLPGDIIPTVGFFEPVFGRLSESVTEATYRRFKRKEFKAALFEDRDALERLTKIWIDDRLEVDKLALALGRQTADERIARLLLNLMDRLTKRGMAQGQTIEFPLRQHHIADAVGLTPVHVSKVMSDFRRRGLIEINDRSLTILDLTGLRRTAVV